MHYLNQEHHNLAEQHRNTLEHFGGLETDLSFYGTSRHPGFFTPFGKNRDTSTIYTLNRVSTMGVKEAFIALLGMPTLRLAAALRNILYIPSYTLMSVHELVDERKNFSDKQVFNHLGTAFYQIAPSIGLSCSFVFQIVKELIALITRAIATVVSWVRANEEVEYNTYNTISNNNSNNNNSSNNDNDYTSEEDCHIRRDNLRFLVSSRRTIKQTTGVSLELEDDNIVADNHAVQFSL